MGVEVEERDTGAKGLRQRLQALGQAVTFGVHADAQPYPDGTDVVEVGATHEFGSPEMPRRSYLRGYVDSGGKAAIGDAAQDQLIKVIEGDRPESVGDKIGDVAVAGVLGFMDRGIRGVASPGYTGEAAGTVRSLDDTGHLQAQIKAKVVR